MSLRGCWGNPMAIYCFWLNPFCEDRSKTACWVSIIGPIFLQSEIQIQGTKRNESLTVRGVTGKSKKQSARYRFRPVRRSQSFC